MRTTVVVELREVVQVRLKIFAGEEDLHIEKLVSELSKEALDVSVLPGRSGFDEPCFHALLFEKLSEPVGAELRSIVEADLLGLSVNQKQPFEFFDEIAASNRRPRLEKQVLSGCHIDDADDTSLTMFPSQNRIFLLLVQQPQIQRTGYNDFYQTVLTAALKEFSKRGSQPFGHPDTSQMVP